MAETKTQDALALLKEDHRKVEKLFKDFESAGENAVKRYRGVPPYRETQAYVKRVTSLYRQLCQ